MKIKAAFKVMKSVVGMLKKNEKIEPADKRFLLGLKFFLFYLFDENPVVIKPTINESKCVLCTRGKSARISCIKKLLNNFGGIDDQRHETDFMLDCLKLDLKNDTSVSVPASILVYDKNAVGRKLCEFDGLVVHPFRKTEQILFIEAKNTHGKASYGKNCLVEKLKKVHLPFDTNDIKIENNDAKMFYTVT